VAKRGRPSEYNEKIAFEICALIVNGCSIREICSKKGFPSLTGVFQWLEVYPDFARRYARARELQAEVYADEIVALSNKALIGTRIKNGPKGKETIVGDNVERSKLQVDARKWVAVKLLRKKYGDEKDAGERKDRLNELEDVFRAGPVKTEEK
jgi:hypothetical protein